MTRAAENNALIVLAVPLPALSQMLGRIRDLAPECPLTDVTSVKSCVLDEVRSVGLLNRFVGGHPMTGTAHSGWTAGDARLFSGAPWVVSVDDHVDPAVWTLVMDLALDCGAVVVPARSDEHDARWVRCRRPMVMVGGELTLEALELAYSPSTGFYSAPVQAVANGGVLVIDDFGRQRCSARDLLNRWIVPLESRVDFLTLKTGQKFELPFMVLVVFATNIRPSELVDEAFLRRIHYKVLAESPTIADFKRIFSNVCREREISYDEQIVDGLLATHYAPKQLAPRGCHPRDLIDQALAQADYLGQPRELTPDLLEAACASYFVDDTETASVTV